MPPFSGRPLVVPGMKRLPPTSTAAPDAYAAGLRLLAGRDLSAAQVAARLEARGCDPAAVRSAIERLGREGAIDDRRMALAWARTLLLVRRRGSVRAWREIEARGVARDLARDAVRQVLEEVDEETLIEQVLARRARLPIRTPAAARRIHAHLLRQGFPADLIRRALRRHGTGPAHREEE